MEPTRVLEVDCFDGRVARARPARLHLEGDRLRLEILEPGAPTLDIDAASVIWAERVRHGARTARLPDGQTLRARDPEAWDAALQSRQGWVARSQQSRRAVLVAALFLVVGLVGVYRWGLPAAARAVTPMIPQTVDVAIGQDTLLHLDGTLLQPSTLDAATRERLQQRVQEVLTRQPITGVTKLRLEFRKSRIGPNAFALPGGIVIVTDELVRLVNDDEVVLGVIGHELGHVQHRHSMRQLVQVTALQAVLSVAMGDYGSFLTLAPLALATMGYSRDHEREADESAVAFLRSAGISPAVMAKFFEQVRNKPGDDKAEQRSSPGISILSSHPDDAERIAYFRKAAESR